MNHSDDILGVYHMSLVLPKSISAEVVGHSWYAFSGSQKRHIKMFITLLWLYTYMIHKKNESLWWYTRSISHESGSPKKYISRGRRPQLICFFWFSKKAHQLQPICMTFADILFWRTRLMRYTSSISPEWCDFSYYLKWV